MTWAVHHPGARRTVLQRFVPVGIAGPSSTALVGLLAAILGAWAAIVAFVGPDFGYTATTTGAWRWTTTNWLLHLVPGAVAFFFGLLVLGSSRARSRTAVSLAALAIVAAGTWLVIGPAVWPWFETSAAYGPAAGPGASFANQIGANLGPGVLLAVFGGMLLKASFPGRVAVADVVTPATAMPPAAMPSAAAMPPATPPAGPYVPPAPPAGTSPVEPPA